MSRAGRSVSIGLDLRAASVVAIARTKAEIVLDEADYERAQQLVKTAATPVRELDQRKANLDIARAQQMAAEAALHTAQLNLEWSEVRAPIGGRVSDRRVDPGNLVAGGQINATSGLASLMRCTNGAKSGLVVGKRTEPSIFSPASVQPLVKAASVSWPGMKSLTAV